MAKKQKRAPSKATKSATASSSAFYMPLRARDLSHAASDVRTVIYIHGIDNKPPEHVLRCQWDRALFDPLVPLGERTRMAYWVFRDRYPKPADGTCSMPDSVRLPEPAGYGVRGVDSVVSVVPVLETKSKEEQKFLAEVDNAITRSIPQANALVAKDIDTFFGAPTNLLFRLVGNFILRDVHDFFFDKARADAMLEAVDRVVRPGGGPFVFVSHSQGTMIALRYLLERGDNLNVPLLVTLGSPLGLPPVRSQFKKWFKKDKLPFPSCVGRWVNVANRGDVVCLDTDLTGDIGLPAADKATRFRNYEINSPNGELRADKHSATGYLRCDDTRREVLDVAGSNFAAPVGLSVISRDVVSEYERTGRASRTRVLIELHQERGSTTASDNLAAELVDFLAAGSNEAVVAEMNIDQLRRYVAADLTREEIERVRTKYAALNVHRVWRDSTKTALISVSTSMVHADAAQRAYRARGQRINWAVLDTGIDANHVHFRRGEENVVREIWDCTRVGPAIRTFKSVRGAPLGGPNLDPNGHGSHVSGIIAGMFADKSASMTAVAPEADLYGFKVLADNGTGQDSYIIKALDKVADINDAAGSLVIHGVNLSLGGDFDPSSYACGHTPLCNELRRLWRQGVVVVLAAGNEGFDVIRTAAGSARQTNFDLSIGDPGNLEDAITVGSVHRDQPHNFGVSFFSSRGPTADGRMKPDVVAPGERIVSVASGKRKGTTVDDYVQMSGTSMAAPHVSGVIAAFLSVRREFIGYPDRVKEILLAHCTNIGRDRFLQGAGIPNLVKMLAGT